MLNWWMVNSGRRREVKVPAGRLLKVDETPKRCREKIKANKLRENLKHFKNSEIGLVTSQLGYIRSAWETKGDK